MDFELTAEQKEIRALARDFALSEVAPVIHRFDESHEFPHEILKSLGKTGLLGALVPEEFGGAALDYVSYALAVEELNRVDASVGITMWAHNSLCTNHIALFGSKEQKAAYLPRLARGEALGAWGLTESGSGSDAAAMQSRAVPGANLLGEPHMGFVNTLQVLEGGRVAMAAMGVGIAQAALDQALGYMKQRRAFGRTLAEFNGLQGMIADIGTDVEAARLLTLRAAALKDAGRPAKTAASMAKLFASEVAMKAATKALQIHGGAGYITEFPIERIFRDAKLTEIGEGTSEIQRMLIARDILGLR